MKGVVWKSGCDHCNLNNKSCIGREGMAVTMVETVTGSRTWHWSKIVCGSVLSGYRSMPVCVCVCVCVCVVKRYVCMLYVVYMYMNLSSWLGTLVKSLFGTLFSFCC